MIVCGVKLMDRFDIASKISNDILELTKKRVLVGVPEATDRREGEGIGNAALAYIHDKGSPLANIPARPFMDPGIKKAQDNINTQFFAAAKAQLNGDKDEVAVRMERAGIIVQNSVRRVINAGEGFVPLKRATALSRLRRRKSAQRWRREKREAVMASMHPLIDTGALRNSITYVVEDVE
jgi:phage gpG-like protein